MERLFIYQPGKFVRSWDDGYQVEKHEPWCQYDGSAYVYVSKSVIERFGEGLKKALRRAANWINECINKDETAAIVLVDAPHLGFIGEVEIFGMYLPANKTEVSLVDLSRETCKTRWVNYVALVAAAARPLENVLFTLFHEVKHVEQAAKGLQQDYEELRREWGYLLHPMEREANEFATAMVAKYISK